jgi:endogenous inhibitor of DNA gyrase (YacG/DUF329 family)
MIINKIKSGKGYMFNCKCDLCGKEIWRTGFQIARNKQHFCSHNCKRGFISKTCMICGKPYDNSFYDKSDYRPLCSKECYSVHFDNWKNDIDNWRKYEAGRKISKKYVCVY